MIFVNDIFSERTILCKGNHFMMSYFVRVHLFECDNDFIYILYDGKQESNQINGNYANMDIIKHLYWYLTIKQKR